MIDESLILFKGKLVFKQYIPSKRHRFGIKLFVLCDFTTKIILDVIVYSGTDVDISKDDALGLSGAIVKKFMASYLNKGHILYTDNWYTSPSLSVYLAQNNTGSCGTVKKSGKHFPRFEAVTQGRSTNKQNCNNLLAVKWKDGRDVHMLTTVHTGNLIESGKIDFRIKQPKLKPDCIVYYNKNIHNRPRQ